MLKEGYLEKQSSGLITKWQSRYFELAGHYLKYYQDKQTKSDKVLKGTIDVHDIREVTVGKDGIILMTLERWWQDQAQAPEWDERKQRFVGRCGVGSAGNATQAKSEPWPPRQDSLGTRRGDSDRR